MGSASSPIREGLRVISMFIVHKIKNAKEEKTINKPPTIPVALQIQGGFALGRRIVAIGVTRGNCSGSLVDTLNSDVKSGRVGECFHITSLHTLFSFCNAI